MAANVRCIRLRESQVGAGEVEDDGDIPRNQRLADPAQRLRQQRQCHQTNDDGDDQAQPDSQKANRARQLLKAIETVSVLIVLRH